MKLGLNVSKSKRRQPNKVDENNSWRNKLRRSRLLAFLPFLLLASLIWVLQTLQIDTVRAVYIPLGTSNISKNYGTQGNVPDYLIVQVKDRGLEHLRYGLSKQDTLQLTLLNDNGQELIGISRSALSDTLASRFSTTATVLQSSFDELKLSVYKRSQKKVPVLAGNITHIPMGSTLSSVSIEPDSVILYGESHKLDTIKEVRTKEIGDSLVLGVFDRSISLSLPQSIHSNTNSVRVHFSVEELTELSLELPVMVLNSPIGYRITPLPGKAEVVVTIPRKYYNTLSKDSLALTADYNGLRTEKETLMLKLTDRQKVVIQSRITPSSIQFIKEKE